MKVGSVILAAGASKRLGRAKQLVIFEGKTLLERTIDAVCNALDGPVLVVTGGASEAMAAIIRTHSASPRLRQAHCPNWADGMGCSLAFGVQSICDAHPNLDAIIVTLCDQPHLNSGVITRLLEAHRTDPTQTAASAYGTTVGPPACFAPQDFAALMQLRGDRGAKALLTKGPRPITKVDFQLGTIEVDTPEDYRSLLNTPIST